MKHRYASGRQAFGEKRLSWAQDAIVAYLVDDSYIASDRHRGVADLAGHIIAGPTEAPERSIVDGYAKAGTTRFARVASSRKAAAIVFAARAGVLIAYCDEVGQFPMQPNGGDIEVKFDPHIFRL